MREHHEFIKYVDLLFSFKTILCALFFIVNVTQIHAQYDSLPHQPFYKQIKQYEKLYSNISTDSSLIKKQEDFYDFAKNHSDKGIQLEAAILLNHENWKTHRDSLPAIVNNLKSIANEAAQHDVWIQEIRAYYYLSHIYWKEQHYTELFETYYTIEKKLKAAEKNLSSESDQRNFALLATINYTIIGKSNYFFKDYKKALYYLKKTLLFKEDSAYIEPKLHAWNTLGLTYYELREYDKSSHYYKKLIDTPYKNISPIYKAIARGNLGINYYKTGDYKNAIPLLLEDLDVSQKYKIYGSALEAAIYLGNLYLKSEQVKEAEKYFHLALEFHPKSSNDDKIHHTYKLYKGLSKLYTAKGDKALAEKYIDSTETALQAHNDNFSALKLIRANQTINEQRQKLLEKERLQEIRERNLIIGIIIALFTISVVFYVYKNKYNQKKMQIKELAYANSKKALKSAQQELDNLTEKIKNNNKIIAQLQENDREKNQKTIQELRCHNILTQEDWEHYQQLFKKVYPDYITTLKTTYVDLTPGEIRHLCLEKLNLSAKETASLLGVSYNSIMVTRHRIRKKLDMEDQKALQKWVAQL